MHTTPMPLSLAEWDEIVALPFVRNFYRLEADEGGREFSQRAYAAKFDFMGSLPSDSGELFFIFADNIGDPPLMLLRPQGGPLRDVYF